MTRSRSLLTLATLTLGGPAAPSQSVSPLNAAEVSALLGKFQAITVTAPAGTRQVKIRVVSQLGTAAQKNDPAYSAPRELYVYDFTKPIRLLVGLAGEPTRRGATAPALSLPGIQPCAPDQQLAILGASTASEMNIAKQCLGMGNRVNSTGGGADVVLTAAPKLNVWTPVYSWYFNKGPDSSAAAFDAARKDPSSRIVWWVYFSSSAEGEAPAVPVYSPRF